MQEGVQVRKCTCAYHGNNQQKNANQEHPSGCQPVCVVLHTRTVREEVAIGKNLLEAWVLCSFKVNDPLLARVVCPVDIFVS